MKLIRMFESMKSWTTLKMGHVGPKLGRVLEQFCVRTRTIFVENSLKFGHNDKLKIGHIE